MSNLKKRLEYLKQQDVKKRWERIDSQHNLTTREKLDKLVRLSLQRKEKERNNEHPEGEKAPPTGEITVDIQQPNKIFQIEEPLADEAIIIRDYSYTLDTSYGKQKAKIRLKEWQDVTAHQLAVIFSDEELSSISTSRLVFFDTETTGLAGGTGTIPFLLGFGYFPGFQIENQNNKQEENVSNTGEIGEVFNVKIFILNDISKEEELLEEVDNFLEQHKFSGVVTYNGKSYDYPLMEARYILYRKRFPLLKLPHLDFLFPARTLWKHTYESRSLGYLGEILLGLSRSDDIESNRIPELYFNYLRTGSFPLIQQVVEHNALDLLGLAGLLLLGVKYITDHSLISDEGEILGAAMLYEKIGNIDKAIQLYSIIQHSGVREDILASAVKRKSAIAKKKKLYEEARQLWEILSNLSKNSPNAYAARELSVHFEHREKNYTKALESIGKVLESIDLTDAQRRDFEKRQRRLHRKLNALEIPGP